jgi:hypothetical protein
MNAIKKTWKFLLRHKAITLSVIILIVVGCYCLFSWQLWKNYQSSYEAAYTQLRIDVDHALALPNGSAEEKDQKIAAFREVAQRPIVECRANILIQWQTVIEPLQARIDDCKQQVVASQTLKERLNYLAQYLHNEESLLTLLVSVSLPDKVEADSFENQVKAWQALSDKLTELQVQPAFEPVKNAARDSIAAISGAWQKLHETNAAQDRATYEEARAKLPEAYDKLAAIDPLSKKQFLELVNSLRTAYDTLYN